MSDLKACDRCGWYEHNRFSLNECNPELGKIADRLMQSVTLKSTKLGYGFGNIAFFFGENKTLVLSVGMDGTFRFYGLFVHDRFDATGMAAIVDAFQNVFSVVPEAR